MKKREQGILTVEASIVLTLMLFFILFLFSFGRVYRAQNLVSHASLQSADAIALESYLRETALRSDAEKISYLASYITESTAISADGLESLRSANLPKIAKEKFISAIASSEAEADKKLKSMGVKDGLAGIDFSECKMDLGSDDVIVAITYTLEMQFPVFGFDDITVTKVAKAKTFGEILFEVSTRPNNPGWGSTSGDDKVTHGSSVVITATPNYGYKFVSWNDGVTDNPRTVTVTDAHQYVAIFEKDQFGVNLGKTVTYDASCAGIEHINYGTVTGAGNYAYMDNATITAVPEANYTFVGWDDNGDGIADNTSPTRMITIDKTYNFKAIFKPVTYKVTVKSNDNSYGSAQAFQGIKKGDTIEAEYGSRVQLIATTKDSVRYLFSKWSNNNTQPSATVIVEGDVAYEAIFITNTYTVTFYNGGSAVFTTNVIRGSSVNGSKSVIASNMPSIPVRNGAIFDKWTYSGGTFTATTVVNSDLNVYASWKYNVILDANGGSIWSAPSKTFSIPDGGIFDFSAYIPSRNGFAFNGWYCDGIKYADNRTINSAATVVASWTCKHRYDNGVTMYEPISGTSVGCKNSAITYRCAGCFDEYVVQGEGACVFKGWCGTWHPCSWYTYCTSGSTHTWNGYSCITCIYCGQCENPVYRKSGGKDIYVSYYAYCKTHNGHLLWNPAINAFEERVKKSAWPHS